MSMNGRGAPTLSKIIIVVGSPPPNASGWEALARRTSTEQTKRQLGQLIGLCEHGDAGLGEHLVARQGSRLRRNVHVPNTGVGR